MLLFTYMNHKPLILLLLITAGLTFGCRRRSAAPSAPEPENSSLAQTEAAAPAQSVATPVAPAQAPLTAPATSQFNYLPGSSAFDDLNKHLTWFVISKKRFPANVDELLAANRMPRPAPPPGGQLVINQKTKTVDYIGPK